MWLVTYRFFSNWLCVVRLVALTVGCIKGKEVQNRNKKLVVSQRTIKKILR